MLSTQRCFRKRFCWHAVALVVAVPPWTGATDPARWLPEDTAIYFGWHFRPLEDAAKAAAERRLQEAMLRFVGSSMPGSDELQWIAPVLGAANALRYAPTAVGLINVEIANGTPDVQFALVTTAEAGAKFTAALERVPFVQNASAVTVRGTPMRNATAADTFPFTWGVHKEWFVFASSVRTAERVLACLDGEGRTLADQAALVTTRRKVQPNHEGEFFDAFIHVDRVRTRVLELWTQEEGVVPPEATRWLEELGLAQFKAKYAHYRKVGGRPELRAFAHVDKSGPRKGLWQLWAQEPLTPADLQLIPKDAYWAYAGNLDLEALWEEVERIMNAAAPEALPPTRGALAMASTMLGFSLTTDFLPALGDTWILVDAPAHGGLLGTGVTLIVELRDAERMREMLKSVVQLVRAGTFDEDAFELKHLELRDGDRVIDYLLLAGVPSPVAPAWTVVADRLIFALHPQTVAAAARQVDPATRSGSLLEHPEWQMAAPRLPAQQTGLLYVNSQSLVRLLYPLVTWGYTLGVSMAGRAGAELDLALWPVLAEAFPDLTNLVLVTAEDADGVLVVGSGAGTEVLAGLSVGLGTGMGVAIPSLTRARESAKRVASGTNLRQIGLAYMVFANERDGVTPASLDELVEKGYITSSTLKSPRDPSGGPMGYVLVPGVDLRGDSQTVLGYEKVFGNEGTWVLFVDGHVSWMALPDFAAAVRDTYFRLGRGQDFPTELQVYLPPSPPRPAPRGAGM